MTSARIALATAGECCVGCACGLEGCACGGGEEEGEGEMEGGRLLPRLDFFAGGSVPPPFATPCTSVPGSEVPHPEIMNFVSEGGCEEGAVQEVKMENAEGRLNNRIGAAAL